MKTTSLSLLCLALVASLGAAEPSAPAFTLPAAPAPQPVEVSPAQLELARQVIKASKFDKVFDQMGAQMQQMAAQSMNLSSPDMSPAKKEAAMKVLGEVMKLATESTKSMLEKVDVIYAEVYSEGELKAMMAFFASPEGQSMLNKQPQIMQRMMPFVQAMQRELMPKIQQIVAKAKADEAAAEALLAPTPAPVPAPAPAK